MVGVGSTCSIQGKFIIFILGIYPSQGDSVWVWSKEEGFGDPTTAPWEPWLRRPGLYRFGDRQRQPSILAIGCRVQPAWVAVWRGCSREVNERHQRGKQLNDRSGSASPNSEHVRDKEMATAKISAASWSIQSPSGPPAAASEADPPGREAGPLLNQHQLQSSCFCGVGTSTPSEWRGPDRPQKEAQFAKFPWDFLTQKLENILV